MLVRFAKLSPDAVVPTYAKEGDACFDLTAISCEFDHETQSYHYDFGLVLEIPTGYVGLIFPRSSVYKTDLSLSNSCGIIDSSYRGSIGAKFKEVLSYESLSELLSPKVYKIGERIAQLMIIPIPTIDLVEVTSIEALTSTKRGYGGFGSSGR